MGRIGEPEMFAWALDIRPLGALVVVEPGYSLEVPVSVHLAIEPLGSVENALLDNG